MRQHHFYKNLCTAILAILLLILVYPRFYAIYLKDLEIVWVDHVIESGDSLWEIASIYCPPEKDVREWIYLIREKNGVRPEALPVGWVLKVPIISPSR